MISEGDHPCSVLPKLDAEVPLARPSFTVDRILGRTRPIRSSGDLVTTHSEYKYTNSTVGPRNLNDTSVSVPQLPAWIYATRFSRQGLPPGYNVRRSQKHPREKKVRQIFSAKQIERLEKEFNKERYVTALKRRELALALDLTETQIKTWFQNRRTKWRKEIRAEIRGNRPVGDAWRNSLTMPRINPAISTKHTHDANLLCHLRTAMTSVLVPPYGCC